MHPTRLLLTAALLGTASAAPLPTTRADLLSDISLQNYQISRQAVTTGAVGAGQLTTLRDLTTGSSLILNSPRANGPVMSAVLQTRNESAALAFTAATTGRPDLVNVMKRLYARKEGTFEDPRFKLSVRQLDGRMRVSVAVNLRPPEQFSADEPVIQAGKAGAGTVRIFTDYGCPYCKELALNALPQWKKTFPDVRFTVHAAPNTRLHPRADRAALYAQCVYLTRPASFAAFETRLYAQAAAWMNDATGAAFGRLVTAAGADVKAVTKCTLGGSARRAVEGMTAQTRALKLNGTPTVYVNGVAMQNWTDTAELRRLLSVTVR